MVQPEFSVFFVKMHMKNMLSFQIGVHLSAKYFVNSATRLIPQMDARYALAMILQVNVINIARSCLTINFSLRLAEFFR